MGKNGGGGKDWGCIVQSLFFLFVDRRDGREEIRKTEKDCVYIRMLDQRKAEEEEEKRRPWLYPFFLCQRRCVCKNDEEKVETREDVLSPANQIAFYVLAFLSSPFLTLLFVSYTTRSF